MIWSTGNIKRYGKIEIYQDKIKQWRFRVKSNNGKILAVGESYSTRASCIKGVNTLKRVILFANPSIEKKENG